MKSPRTKIWLTWIRGWLPKEAILPTYQPVNTDAPKTSLRDFSSLHLVIIIGCLCGISLSVTTFSDNPVAFAVFAWGTGFEGAFLALGSLVAIGKKLNPKVAAGLLLSTISLGGVLVNIYLFSVQTGFLTRLLFASLLVAFHAPLAVGFSARARGKEQLYRRIIGYYPTKYGWFNETREETAV